MAELESTFLTSLRGDPAARNKQAKRENLLEDLKSGKEILQKYEELQLLADELDQKVENKLSSVEDIMMVGTRNLINTFKKEMNDLRRRADEEETKSRRDAKIRSLEKELDWFMNEALRLDELCKKYKKELDKWKGKSEALEDDRQFLENQIKTAKKNNKTLRGSVEKAQTAAYSALVAADGQGPEGGVAPGSASSPVLALPPPAQSGAPPRPPAAADRELSRAGATNAGASPSNGGPLSEELEQRYSQCVRKLKSQLEGEQRLVAKLRAVSEHQFGEPSELESFFLECIDKIKDDVQNRRRSMADEREALTGKKALKEDGTPAALPEVTIEDFQAADRRKVVEHLLSSDQVLTFLYDKLFPQPVL